MKLRLRSSNGGAYLELNRGCEGDEVRRAAVDRSHNPAARPKVSVIVPVKDGADTLDACLAGLAAQAFDRAATEIIFVNNNSTDDSVDILQATPFVHLVSECKQGAYAARNTGVTQAKGDVLVFLDPDCVPDPHWIQSAVEAVSRAGVLIALGVRRPVPDMGWVKLVSDYEVTKDAWVLSSGDRARYFGYTNNMAMRRSTWETFGPFVERVRGSDTIFVQDVVHQAGDGSVVFVPNMRVAHLEIDGLAAYFRKVFTYGRSLQSYRRAVPARPVSFRDRIAIFRQTAKEMSYGVGQVASLAALLITGQACWMAGRLYGLAKKS